MSSYILDNKSLEKIVAHPEQQPGLNFIGNRDANQKILSTLTIAHPGASIIDFTQINNFDAVKNAFDNKELLLITNLEKASSVDQNQLISLLTTNSKGSKKPVIVISDIEEEKSFASTFYKFLVPMEVDNASFKNTRALRM